MLKIVYSKEWLYSPCVEEIDFGLNKNQSLFFFFFLLNRTHSIVGKENQWKHLPLKCDKVFNKSATLLDSPCHSQWNSSIVCPYQYFIVLFWKSIISSILPGLYDLLFYTQFWNIHLHLCYSILGTRKDFASGFIYAVPVNVVIFISLSCHFATNAIYLIKEHRERNCVLTNYRGLINGLSYFVSKSLEAVNADGHINLVFSFSAVNMISFLFFNFFVHFWISYWNSP